MRENAKRILWEMLVILRTQAKFVTFVAFLVATTLTGLVLLIAAILNVHTWPWPLWVFGGFFLEGIASYFLYEMVRDAFPILVHRWQKWAIRWTIWLDSFVWTALVVMIALAKPPAM